MALQSDAIESRLEGLKLDDNRMMYDSKLRAFRRESTPGNFASKSDGEVDPIQPIDQVILLLEELSRRIDGLEKKNRHLTDEIRHRGREDRSWRSVFLAVGLISSVVIYFGGVRRWF